MGIINKIFRNGLKTKQNTLKQDIYEASELIVKALNSSGYIADYTLDSMKEIDRFFDEQNKPNGILSSNTGRKLFALSSYVGQTAIRLYGGQWITDDTKPEGEMTIAVQLSDGSIIWPAIRCMKRYKNGSEDSLYAYLLALDND